MPGLIPQAQSRRGTSMAIGHIKFDDQTDVGRKARAGINMVNEGIKLLADAVQETAQMKDAGAVTSYLQAEIGAADLTEAQEFVAELEAIHGKLTSDGSQSSVYAAILQAHAKFGD